MSYILQFSETVQEKGTERHVQVTNRTGKIKTAKELKEVQRAKTLEELHQRLDSYKGMFLKYSCPTLTWENIWVPFICSI